VVSLSHKNYLGGYPNRVSRDSTRSRAKHVYCPLKKLQDLQDSKRCTDTVRRKRTTHFPKGNSTSRASRHTCLSHLPDSKGPNTVNGKRKAFLNNTTPIPVGQGRKGKKTRENDQDHLAPKSAQDFSLAEGRGQRPGCRSRH